VKKLDDKQSEFCKKCKSKQKFKISEISEYGEAYGMCDRCCNSQKF